MEGQRSDVMLTVPEQKLTALSFCGVNTRDLEAWVQSLPMANIGETAKRLYHAVIELNQLIVAPVTRFQLQEILRAPIYFVCRELSKHFLNQPISLPEKQRKIANLAQALQLHLASGYKIVVLELSGQPQPEKIRKLIAQACHRAMSDLGRTLVRSCQLYCASPPQVWLEIHQLYRLAEQHGLLSLEVQDAQNRHVQNSSITDVYKRILLLGCSKPNQLRQADIATMYDVFECWTDHLEVGNFAAGSALFIVNQLKDSPPIYRSLHNGPVTDDYCGLDPSELVQLLTEYLAQMTNATEAPQSILRMPTRLPDTLILHLTQALGILTKRTFKRIASNGKLFLCVGLSASHYYCSDGVDFAIQLVGDPSRRNDDGNIFMQRMKKQDVWSGSIDATRQRDESSAIDLSPIAYTGISAKNTSKEPAYRQYRVSLVNTSPGGYCLQWQGEMPANVQAGEILAVREEECHPWSIAVIRWIRQVKQQGTQIGIELLAPSAKPCGAQLLQKTGEGSEYLRGLMLPELATIGQPATLILPRLPFQTGHRILLNQQGEETKLLLTRRVSATGSFSQFEFRNLSQSQLPDTQAGKSGGARSTDDDFDSLWPSL